MAGAPSQIDLFDHKPKLQKHDGQPIPEDIVKGERFAFIKGTPRLLGSPFAFEKHGQSGAEISDAAPAPGDARRRDCHRPLDEDDAVQSRAGADLHEHRPPDHRPAESRLVAQLRSRQREQGPSAFVVLMSGQNNPDGGKSCWGSGFLPTVHQGVEFRSKGEPVLFSANPDGVDAAARRESLDLVADLNRAQHETVGDPETVTRIAAYELAYRMQTSVPELTDISTRAGTASTRCTAPSPGRVSFANNCLLARRLVERGVRFVQLYHRGWDTHGASAGTDIVRAPAATVRRDRPRDRRAPHRPEAARPARHHAGHLGRRVRADADQRSAERVEAARPRSPSARVHDVAGRRRHPGRG